MFLSSNTGRLVNLRTVNLGARTLRLKFLGKNAHFQREQVSKVKTESMSIGWTLQEFTYSLACAAIMLTVSRMILGGR